MPRLVVLLVLVLAACSAPPDPFATSGRPEESPPAAAPARTPSPPKTAAAQVQGLPVFTASVQPVGPALLDRMRFSHRPGCPLDAAELRHVRVSFVGFDGRARVGELVVHRDHAPAVAAVFEQLYAARWPIHQMRLVDDYGGDDDRSMAANNTSGYNCRRVAGSASWSQHAYGTAIDINPVQNPYVAATSIAPPEGRPFAAVDRSAEGTIPMGVIREGDVVIRAFARIGWEWGGDWSRSKDYQHFSATGG